MGHGQVLVVQEVHHGRVLRVVRKRHQALLHPPRQAGTGHRHRLRLPGDRVGCTEQPIRRVVGLVAGVHHNHGGHWAGARAGAGARWGRKRFVCVESQSPSPRPLPLRHPPIFVMSGGQSTNPPTPFPFGHCRSRPMSSCHHVMCHHVMCHHVMCHVSCVMCHASCAMRHAPCAMRHAPCAMRHGLVPNFRSPLVLIMSSCHVSCTGTCHCFMSPMSPPKPLCPIDQWY